MFMKTENALQDPISKYKLLFTKPKTFFKEVVKEKDYQAIAIYVGFVLAVGELLEYIAWFPSVTINDVIPKENILRLGIAGIIMNPLLTLGVTLVLAWFINIFLSFFEKNKDFFTTWKVIAYSMLIPIVYSISISLFQTIAESLNPWADQSIFATHPTWGLYSLLMTILFVLLAVAVLVHVFKTQVIGLKEYYKLTTKQAFTVVICSTILFLLLLIFLFVVIGMYAVRTAL